MLVRPDFRVWGLRRPGADVRSRHRVREDVPQLTPSSENRRATEAAQMPPQPSGRPERPRPAKRGRARSGMLGRWGRPPRSSPRWVPVLGPRALDAPRLVAVVVAGGIAHALPADEVVVEDAAVTGDVGERGRLSPFCWAAVWGVRRRGVDRQRGAKMRLTPSGRACGGKREPGFGIPRCDVDRGVRIVMRPERRVSIPRRKPPAPGRPARRVRIAAAVARPWRRRWRTARPRPRCPPRSRARR